MYFNLDCTTITLADDTYPVVNGMDTRIGGMYFEIMGESLTLVVDVPMKGIYLLAIIENGERTKQYCKTDIHSVHSFIRSFVRATQKES